MSLGEDQPIAVVPAVEAQGLTEEDRKDVGYAQRRPDVPYVGAVGLRDYALTNAVGEILKFSSHKALAGLAVARETSKRGCDPRNRPRVADNRPSSAYHIDADDGGRPSRRVRSFRLPQFFG